MRDSPTNKSFGTRPSSTCLQRNKLARLIKSRDFCTRTPVNNTINNELVYESVKTLKMIEAVTDTNKHSTLGYENSRNCIRIDGVQT